MKGQSHLAPLHVLKLTIRPDMTVLSMFFYLPGRALLQRRWRSTIVHVMGVVVGTPRGPFTSHKHCARVCYRLGSLCPRMQETVLHSRLPSYVEPLIL